MSAKSAHLTLRPDRCDGCGKCLAACPNDALRVGSDYILVDWHACNQCCACVQVCDKSAIQRAIMPLRSTAAVPSVAVGDVAKVVVGSRAEAKAVRKAAEQAAKQAARGGGRTKAAAPAQAAQPLAAAAGAAVAAGAGMAGAGAAAMSGASTAASGAGAVAAGTTPASAGAIAAPTTLPRGSDSGITRSTTSGSAFKGVGAPWTRGDALIMLAVLLVTLTAKMAILGLPSVALMPAAGRALTRAIVLTLYYGVQISALVLLAGRHGVGLADAFGLRRAFAGADSAPSERLPVGLTALMTVGMLVGVEAVAIGYGLLAQAVGWSQPVTLSADVSTVFGGGGGGLVLSVLLVALVAPIAEELAFRGVILGAVGTRWGRWPAILVSAALFAAYHVNLWLFVPMFALGAALSWLVVARRSLWPAIALHVMYNSLAIAAAFLVPR